MQKPCADEPSSPLNAGLARALLISEEVLRRYQVEAPALVDVLEHLWEWLTVTPDTFWDWHIWSSQLYDELRSGNVPTDLKARLVEAGLGEQASTEWLPRLVRIVEYHLFGAIDREDAQQSVDTVVGVGEAADVQLAGEPDYSVFGSPDAHAGWGAPISSNELTRWRQAAG